MTRPTALALIRRLDINRTLAAAGRAPTLVDVAEATDLLDRAEVEDALRYGWRGVRRG